MMQRAKVISLLKLLLVLTAAPLSVRAQAQQRIQEAHPRAGFDAMAAAIESAGQVNGARARLESMLKEAADAYQRASFGVAIDWYDNALSLAPDNAGIKSLLAQSEALRAAQREALAAIPENDEKREEYFSALRDQANAFVKQKDHAGAVNVLTQLWIVAGDYRGDTVKNLENARRNLGVAKPGAAAGEAAKAAEAPAAPMTQAPPVVEKPGAPAAAAAPAGAEDVDTLIVQAQAAAANGNVEAAREALNRALAIQPENRTAKYHLSKLGAPAEAPKMVKPAEGAAGAVAAASDEAARKEARAQANALLEKAEAAAQAGNFDEAERAYREVAKLIPGEKLAVEGLERVAAGRMRSQTETAKAQAAARAEAEAKALAQAKAKAEAEAMMKAEAEAKALAQAQAKAEKEAAARAEAEAKAMAEAQAKAEVAAREKAEAAARIAEQEAKIIADAKARKDEADRMKAEAEAKTLAEAQAKAQAEARMKAEAEVKAIADAQARAEAEAKMKAETEAKAIADAQAKAEAEARMKAETEAKAIADAQAKAEAEARTKAEAVAVAERAQAEIVGHVTSALDRAAKALADGDVNGAEAAYRDALKIESGNKAAISGLEQVAVARVQQSQAADRASRVKKLLSEADAQLAANSLDKARKNYAAVLKLEPANEAALQGLDQIGAREIAAAQNAKSAGSQDKIERAKVSLEFGDLAQARSMLEEVLRANPSNPEAIDLLKQVARIEVQTASNAVAPTENVPLQPIDQVAGSLGDKIQVAVEPGAPASRDLSAGEPGVEAMAAPADPSAAPEPPEVSDATVQITAENKEMELDRLHREALEQYRAGDVAGARQSWESMLAIEPGERRATVFLEQTQAEFERKLADVEAAEKSAEKREQARQLLNSPITISTDRATPLAEFMRIISFSTASELEFYIAEGAEASVFVNFVDKPLKDVLDTVLHPIGLVWEMDENNLITIRPELFSRTFKLNADQMSKVRSLLDSGDLQRVIWGQPEAPAKGVEMTLDERQRIFLVVGSKLHIEKIDDFMATLETGVTPDLETRIYKIREEQGPKIKALVNALIAADPTTPFSQERKIFIDGSDLIIRDTPENIIKIEELLLDENFIEQLGDETLDIVNFSLVPRDVENQSSEQISVFTNRIVEAVETFLYAQSGKRAAQAAGRRLWFDPATFQLTIVDTPSNISNVGKFIESLPEVRQRRLQKVIFLQHAVAEEMASNLVEVLGLTTVGGGPGAVGGEQTVLKLRRGDEATFRDLRIRVVRVEEGDPNDRNDDEVEVNLITGTTQSNITLRELETQFFEDYELSAEDVQPSGGGGVATSNRGEGSARILIRYIPPIEDEFAGPGGAAAAAAAAATEEPVEEEGLTISPFGPLNALIIRYDNPARLNDVEDLIDQLDRPTKQVEVETKFVQVNESRAREFSADFNIEGLGNDRSIDTDIWRLNSRFANFRDEARDIAEPPIENPLSANLLRGTTVLNFILGDNPGLSFELRLLEAEGVINITNGPKVTMLDAITGEFRIEKIGPPAAFTVPGGTTATQGGFGSNQNTQQNTMREEDSSRFNNRITSVILEVTPEITSEKSIIFEIVAELLDFDNFVGQQTLILPSGGSVLLDPNRATGGNNTALAFELPSWIDPDPSQSLLQTGFAQFILSNGNMFQTRKLIDTTARTHDGGTIVLGGWTGERAQELTSGVPVLRNMPYIGKLFFSRNQRSLDRVTLLIFLTANLVE